MEASVSDPQLIARARTHTTTHAHAHLHTRTHPPPHTHPRAHTHLQRKQAERAESGAGGGLNSSSVGASSDEGGVRGKERAEVLVVVDSSISIDTGGRAALRWLDTKDIVEVCPPASLARSLAVSLSHSAQHRGYS